VGDIIFAHAYLAISRLREKDVSADRIRVAFTHLNQTCISLCQGQYLDLEFEDRAQVDMALYMKMIENKTAALIACATEIGAVIGGASPAIVEHYRQFGRELGLGFQIMDDILGIWGDPQITGKPICDDLRTKKKTLPVLHALETERKRGKRTLRDLYSREEIGDDDIERMLAVLEETGSHQYAREVLSGYRARALEKLEATGIDNQSQQTLVSLCRNALDREY
jgi:geranylgeranyl diphosphate synthase type I